MKRPSYRDGIRWIARNDETAETDPAEIGRLISVCMLADLFGVTEERVAMDVVRERAKPQRPA